jgi:hypothetical protein
LLAQYKRDFHKVGLGGCARIPKSQRHAWLSQVFARAWPCRFHGFGIASRETLLRFPFHSADASTWQFAPFALGLHAIGDRNVRFRFTKPGDSSRLATQAVSGWLEKMWRIQVEVRSRWAREMKSIREIES